MNKFFISHSSKDIDVAMAIYGILKNNGDDCWISGKDIQPGDPWPAEIRQILKSEGVCLVLLLTQNANESENVTNEVSLAQKNHRKIIPFQIGDFELSGSLEYFLTNVHMHQCKKTTEAELEQEISDILLRSAWEKARSPKREFGFSADMSILKDYVPRVMEQAIRDRFAEGKIATLHGEGGMGKSTLAIHYYLTNREKYGGLIFVNAETPSGVLDSLEIPLSKEIRQIYSVLLKAFEELLELLSEQDAKKPLIIIDNLSYDRDKGAFEGFEETLSDVIESLHALGKADILVTTRRPAVRYQPKEELIPVGDFSEALALDYLKLGFPASKFVEADAIRLIRRYGEKKADDEGECYKIPAISCVALKNAAKLHNSYGKVVAPGGSGKSLRSLVKLQLKSILADELHSEDAALFVDILKLASYLNGSSIRQSLLYELVSAWRGSAGAVSWEQFHDCVAQYNERLTLLNYKSSGTDDDPELTIHGRFQAEINALIKGEERSMKVAVISVLLKRLHRLSYYGTYTLQDRERIMPHAYVCLKTVKNEYSGRSEDYYSLLRMTAWFYGFAMRDSETSDDFLNRSDGAPEFERILCRIDQLLLQMLLGDDRLTEEEAKEETEEEICAIRSDIDLWKNRDDERKELSQKLLRIRLAIAVSYNDWLRSPLDESVERAKKGIALCQELLDGSSGGYELPDEEYAFVTESIAVLLCRKAAIERKKGGRKDNLYDESVRSCVLALRHLEEDERYLHILRSQKRREASGRTASRERKADGKLGNTYLKAFAKNLMGVALMEKCASLEDLYNSEKYNQAALEEYRGIGYLPGIANQRINFINIYRAQATLIIDSLNSFLRAGNRTEPTREEWAALYQSEELVPTIRTRDGSTLTVAEWIERFHALIERVKRVRAEYRRDKLRYHAELSVDYYAYMFTLAATRTHYNAYTAEQKRDILLGNDSVAESEDGVGVWEGIDAALRSPQLDIDQKVILTRYHGTLNRRLGELAETEEDRLSCWEKALTFYEEALALALKAGNQSAEKQTQNELSALRKRMPRQNEPS